MNAIKKIWEWVFCFMFTLPIFLAAMVCGDEHPITRTPWDFGEHNND